MLLRTIKCDIPECSNQLTEKEYGEGWPDWGQYMGAALNGKENPNLCPGHAESTLNFIDSIKVEGGSK